VEKSLYYFGYKESRLFLGFPLILHEELEIALQKEICNYVLEVGKDISSFVYGAEIYKKERELSQPYYSDLPSFLADIGSKEIAPYFVKKFGMKIKYLIAEEYGPVDSPYLGLLEYTRSQREGLAKERSEIISAKLKRREIKKDEESEQIQPAYKSNQVFKWEKIEVNFYSDRKVKIIPESFEKFIKNIEIGEGKLSESDKQRTLLLLKYFLEFFIEKQNFHWLYGFVIFPSWRERKIDDYLRALSKYICFLNKLGEKTGLWRIKRTKPRNRSLKGYWVLDLAETRTKFSSNILKAKGLYNTINKYNDFNRRLKILNEAINLYPDYLEVRLLLVQYWEEREFRNVSLKEVEEMRRFSVEKKKIYEKAYNSIIQSEDARSYWHQGDTLETKHEIHKKFQKIEHASRVLENWCKKQKILSPKEEECERIKELIENVAKEK